MELTFSKRTRFHLLIQHTGIHTPTETRAHQPWGLIPCHNTQTGPAHCAAEAALAPAFAQSLGLKELNPCTTEAQSHSPFCPNSWEKSMAGTCGVKQHLSTCQGEIWLRSPVDGLSFRRRLKQRKSILSLRISDTRQQTLWKEILNLKWTPEKAISSLYKACSDPSAQLHSATLTTVISSLISPKLCTDVIPSCSFAFCTFVLLRGRIC